MSWQEAFRDWATGEYSPGVVEDCLHGGHYQKHIYTAKTAFEAGYEARDTEIAALKESRDEYVKILATYGRLLSEMRCEVDAALAKAQSGVSSLGTYWTGWAARQYCGGPYRYDFVQIMWELWLIAWMAAKGKPISATKYDAFGNPKRDTA